MKPMTQQETLERVRAISEGKLKIVPPPFRRCKQQKPTGPKFTPNGKPILFEDQELKARRQAAVNLLVSNGFDRRESVDMVIDFELSGKNPLKAAMGKVGGAVSSSRLTPEARIVRAVRAVRTRFPKGNNQ